MAIPITLDEQRWQAVIDRDASQDRQFVFAVRTTGVYCRPSCKCRQPLRQNVHFYDSPAQAEAAGFRACKRCAPDRLAFEAEIGARVCAFIDAHLDERLTLDRLGEAVGLSPAHLQRVFKQVTGVSPRQYVEVRRIGQLKANLREGQPIAAALYDAGFSSSSRVYEESGAKLGMTPAAYRKGGAGMHIRYTISECPLGYLLVGATERGLCAVSLGDSPAAVEQWLQTDYPQAELEQADAGLAAVVEQLVRHLAGDLPHLDLPLDVQATAFQLRVWEALRQIPYGETRSYAQVAQALGEPTAARAVARACASNRVALVIPCHRVVRGDGDLSGYRWGVKRKAALLATERQ
ncbi:MAG TPA: bifunctional DNA-binding transcriptional regulator/O6-methylguanine-DNA methyltransferase Ada [Aggregatilineales bacterium]|nr:bifunctional DNA-binding transcriptional regulator/O6-methylguanine-DNA methyltransferase Ada [Aggregatilineales bacterium]